MKVSSVGVGAQSTQQRQHAAGHHDESSDNRLNRHHHDDDNEEHEHMWHLQQEVSLLHEKLTIYETMISQQKHQIEDLITKNQANNASITATTQDCNHKLDMTTSRILELETILSLVKLETEERMKANSNYSFQISQEQIRIKDIVLSLSSKFEDFCSAKTMKIPSSSSCSSASSPSMKDVTKLLQSQLVEGFQTLTSCWNALEGHLYEILNYQSRPTVLSHETSDLFSTINSLNNTIKSIKMKASNRLKKVNDQYHEIETTLQQLQSDSHNTKMKYELLQADYDQLKKVCKQQERDIVMTKTELVRFRRTSDELSKGISGKDQVVDQLYLKCNDLQQERDKLTAELSDLKAEIESRSKLEEEPKSQQAEQEEKSKKSKGGGSYSNGNSNTKELEDTIAALKLELSVTQQDAKRKLGKRKKELVAVYEEHKTMRIEYNMKVEQLTMSLQDITMKYQVLHEKYHNQQLENNKSMMKVNELQFQLKTLERSYEELRVNQEIQGLKHRTAQEELQDTLLKSNNAFNSLKEEYDTLQQSMETKTKKWKAMMHRVNEYERVTQELRGIIQEKTDQISHLQDMQSKIHLKEEDQLKCIFTECISNLEKAWKMKFDEMEITILKKTKQLVELSSVLEYTKVKQSTVLSQYKGQLSLIEKKSKKDIELLQRRIDELHIVKVKEEELMLDQWKKQMISDYQQLQEQHQTLTNQLALVHQEVMQLQQSVKELTNENVVLKETVSNQTTSLSDKSSEITRQNEKIHQLQGIINQKQEQINDYYQRMKISDDLTRQLSQEKDQLTHAHNELQEILFEKHFAYDSLFSANAVLKEENTALVKRIGEDIRSQIKQLEEDIDTLHEEKLTMKQEKEQLQAKVQRLEQENSELQTEIDIHLHKIQVLQDEHLQQEEQHAKVLIECNHEKSTLLQQLNYSTTSYVQVKQELSNAQKEISSKEVEMQHLQDRLMIYKQEYRKQEKEMAKMVALFQQEFATLQGQIADIATFNVTKDSEEALCSPSKVDNSTAERHMKTSNSEVDDESPLKTSQRVGGELQQQQQEQQQQSKHGRYDQEPRRDDHEDDCILLPMPTYPSNTKDSKLSNSPARDKKKEQEIEQEKAEVKQLDKFGPVPPNATHPSPRKNLVFSPTRKEKPSSNLQDIMTDAANMIQLSKNLNEPPVVNEIKSERPKSRGSAKVSSSDRSKTPVKRVVKTKKASSPSKQTVSEGPLSPKSPKRRH